MNKNKTIIMFLPKEVKTGGEKYLMKIYEYFKGQGIRIEPIYNDFPKRFRYLGLVIDCLLNNFWLFWKIKCYRKVKNVILFEDFHSHPRLLLCNFLMRIINRNLKIVTLMQLSLFYHDIFKNALFKKLDRLAIRLFFKQVSKILCNSEFTRQEVLSIGVASHKVEVVYCGYDGITVRLAGNKMAKDKKEILFVGQCAAYKGLIYLLKAVSLLPDDGFIVNIVGNTEAEPSYFELLSRTMAELSLGDRVVFHGHVADKKTLALYYTQADIFVLPSLVEGFAIVLLEAMSFGLPVVATSAGSVPELVRDGENGFLVLPKNPEVLAGALKQLLDSAKLRRKLGSNGRNFYLSHREFYSWDKVGERICVAIER